MDYLALDTNIFINMCLKRTESVTAPCYKSLKQLLDEDRIRLVLPEIVKVEFKRNVEPEFRNSRRFIHQVIKDLNKIVFPLDITDGEYSWSEIDRLKREITNNLQEILEKFKAMDITKQIAPIQQIMQHRNTEEILTSDELIIKAYKRVLEKKAPAHKDRKRSEGDCLIVESLIQHFSNKNDIGKAFFISYNKDDFTDPEDEKREKLHPDLKPAFDALGIKYDPHLAKILKEEFHMDIDEKDVQFEEEVIRISTGPSIYKPGILFRDWDYSAAPLAALNTLSGVGEAVTVLPSGRLPKASRDSWDD